jgi:EAL domain-containing protein (putative c-di-GMP-specific phosphodiesterase class I)
MRSDPDGRVALEDELRAAIEKKQLKLDYQPIFYLPTETLAGFEAVLRWEHPRLGVLNPTHFVPVAEESDLIIKLGSYVLTRAVREVQRWQRELPRPEQPLFVSINISSRQLFRPELISEVRHLLGRAVLPKGSLRLEITETLAMENPEKAAVVLEQLSAAGAGLSIDEFATGYSSLSYLMQFAFDTIKVDRAFVQGRTQNGTGAVALRSIVALAHELGKKVVAEGVEAEDDAAFLRSIGCEYAQGFYYGEPMAERDLVQLLRVVRRAERRLRRSTLFRQRVRPRDSGPEPAVVVDAPNGQHPPDAYRPPVNGSPEPPPPAPPVQAQAAPPPPPRLPRAGPPTGTPGGPPPLPRSAPVRGDANGAGLKMPPMPLRKDPSPGMVPQRERTATAPPPVPPPSALQRNGAGRNVQPPRAPQPPPLRQAPPPGAGAVPRPPLPAIPPTRTNGRPPADFSRLPPAIRASLERLAGQISEEEAAHAAPPPPPPIKPEPG